MFSSHAFLFSNRASGFWKRGPMLRGLLLGVLCIFTACSNTHREFNPTTPKYQINSEALQKKPLKKLIIATANLSGEPTRYHLQSAAVRIDESVKKYLQEHGYQIVPSYLFENAWTQAIRTYGNMYDPTTGKVDPQTWRAVIVTTFKTLQQTTDADGIVFADVISLNSAHDVGLDHLAQWDGVRRKPAYTSSTAEMPEDFDWAQNVEVASLAVTIYSIDGEGLFSSRGGLDTLQEINTKNKPTFVRRKHILENDSNIEEGIEIAFHPFIKMQSYPGDEK